VKNKNHFIIYFIIATVIATIAIQVYWNIKNYKGNKQRLISEVQLALDNGIEDYYANLAKTDMIAFIDTASDTAINPNKKSELFIKNVLKHPNFISFDSLSSNNYQKEDTIANISFVNKTGDTLHFNKSYSTIRTKIDSSLINTSQVSSISVVKGKSSVDSLDAIKSLTNKIILSITRDSIVFNDLNKFIENELKRKDIDISYALGHYNKDTTIIASFSNINDDKLKLFAFSKSTYLPRSEKLKIAFSNISMIALKRGLTGIILSFLLSASIIACLLYLLNIIKQQKELAEIKNDLISNITHEFKTPIATVSTALEGIEKFNLNDDKEKTKKYLGISNQQLKKLHLMVEKLLETSTLDSDKLLLNKENIDIVGILQGLTEKHQMIAPDKFISFKSNIENYSIEIDPFHFENAISNLIDNAIKYGGNTIEINLNLVLDSCEITIADSGNTIEKGHREKIFDKFYRIPTGNQHDVKGFGIGLYYTKKIIEKHLGTVQLIPDTKYTIFKIHL